MKPILKILLFLILPFVVSAQAPQNKLDSLHFALKNATEDTKRMGAYDQLRFYYQEVDWDSALYYAESELSIARKLKLALEEARILDEKGYILMKFGNYPKSLETFLQALKIAENPESEKNILNLPKNQTTRTYRLGILEWIYHDLGHLYRYTGNTDKAIVSYLKAKSIAGSINDPILPAFVYMNLGITYLGLNKLDSALLLENEALTLFTKFKTEDSKYEGTVLNYIGTIYQKKGENDLSRSYLYKAIQTSEERDNLSSLTESYLSLSNLYRNNKQLDSSIFYAKKILQLVHSVNAPLRIADAYTYLSFAFKEKNNSDSAYTYLNLASTLKDSLNKIKIQKLNEFLNVGFNEQIRLEELEKEKIKTQGKIRTYGLLGGIGVFLIIIISLYRNNKQKQKANKVLEEKNNIIRREKKRSEELLLNILPAEVATELKQTGHCQAKTFSMVTVMFMDFKDFTSVSEKVSAELLVDEINSCFSAFDGIIQKYKIEKIKTVGDSYICAGGLPVLNQTHAKDIVHAAIEIQGFMLARKKEKEDKDEFAFEMRIGIHTGPVVAGIVGVKKFQYDIWGDTVNLAARMEQNSEAGKINVSGSTYKLVKDKFNCTYRGKIEAKNKGEVEMYFVESIA